jgi:hypothetical protein
MLALHAQRQREIMQAKLVGMQHGQQQQTPPPQQQQQHQNRPLGQPQGQQGGLSVGLNGGGSWPMMQGLSPAQLAGMQAYQAGQQQPQQQFMPFPAPYGGGMMGKMNMNLNGMSMPQQLAYAQQQQQQPQQPQ